MGLFNALLESPYATLVTRKKGKECHQGQVCSCTNSQPLIGNKKVGVGKSNEISLEYTLSLGQRLTT